MASVQKRHNSKYFAACFRDKSGRQRMRSTGETDRKKAEKKAEIFESAYRGKRSLAQAWKVLNDLARETGGEGLDEVSLRAYMKRWLAAIKNEVDPNTLDSYESRAKTFLKVMTTLKLDLIPLSQITKANLVLWRDTAAPLFASWTVNQTLTQIKRIFKTAHDDNVIPENPAASVARISGKSKGEKRVNKRPFTFAELRLVLPHCVGPFEEWRSIVMFGLYTGQRLGDIISLRWHDLDLINEEVRLVTRKTGATVIVPLTEALKNFILKLEAPHDPNEMLHPKAYAKFEATKKWIVAPLSTEFAELLCLARLRVARDRKAGPTGGRRKANALSFHSLRHTLVSMLKNAGVSSSIVQDIVGHESAAVNQMYTHIDPKSKALAMRKLPAIDFTDDLF